MFTKNFDKYVCVGESITCQLGNLTIRARVERDPDYTIDDDDCHNTDQSVTGCSDEEFARLLEARKAYFCGRWWYGVVVLSVELDGVVIQDYAATLGAIEINYPNGDNKYLLEVANELLDENKGSIRKSAKEFATKLLNTAF